MKDNEQEYRTLGHKPLRAENNNLDGMFLFIFQRATGWLPQTWHATRRWPQEMGESDHHWARCCRLYWLRRDTLIMIKTCDRNYTQTQYHTHGKNDVNTPLSQDQPVWIQNIMFYRNQMYIPRRVRSRCPNGFLQGWAWSSKGLGQRKGALEDFLTKLYFISLKIIYKDMLKREQNNSYSRGKIKIAEILPKESFYMVEHDV